MEDHGLEHKIETMQSDSASRQKRSWKWPAIWILYIAAFLFLSRYDLQASLYLTSIRNRWVVWWGTHIAILPASLILAYCGSCLYLVTAGWKRGLMMACAVIGSMIASFYILQPKWNLAGFLLIAALGFCIWMRSWYLAHHVDLSRPEAVNACLVGLLLVVSAMAATSLLKMVWGRPRFISLADPQRDFVPWYQFHGFTLTEDLHKSFPSGHTTAAATVLWITLLPKLYPSLAKRERTLWILAVLWIAVAAFTRIMAGMHFISDTMGAFMVGLGFFLYYRAKLMSSNQSWIGQGKKNG